MQRVHRGPVALQESSNAVSMPCPGHVVYANHARTVSSVLPHSLGGQVVAELSEEPFCGLVFSTRLAIFSVYLLDIGKTEFAYESALASLVVGVEAVVQRHGTRALILAGDWNVELALTCDLEGDIDVAGGALGPWLSRAAPMRAQRQIERQDMLLDFCASFRLHHGPSFLQSASTWTREGWGRSLVRLCNDFVLLSHTLQLSR